MSITGTPKNILVQSEYQRSTVLTKKYQLWCGSKSQQNWTSSVKEIWQKTTNKNKVATLVAVVAAGAIILPSFILTLKHQNTGMNVTAIAQGKTQPTKKIKAATVAVADGSVLPLSLSPSRFFVKAK